MAKEDWQMLNNKDSNISWINRKTSGFIHMSNKNYPKNNTWILNIEDGYGAKILNLKNTTKFNAWKKANDYMRKN